MLIRQLRSAEIAIPHEPEQWMVFKRLNGRRLQEAADAKLVKAQKRAAGRLKAIGPEAVALQREEAQRVAEANSKALADAKATLGDEAVKALEQAALEGVKQAMSAPASETQVLERYDRLTLLRLGIHSWSYESEPAAELAEENEDGGLDERTEEWAYRQILTFNELLPQEADAALKN